MEEGVIADRRWQETRNQYQSLSSEANEQDNFWKLQE
jgi:hypothetical protein